MAIGPMAGFTKKVGRILGKWGIIVLKRALDILYIIIFIVLVPVAAGLLIAAAGVGLAGFIVYLIVAIIFTIGRLIWECTPVEGVQVNEKGSTTTTVGIRRRQEVDGDAIEKIS
jgi:hypothetical protein